VNQRIPTPLKIYRILGLLILGLFLSSCSKEPIKFPSTNSEAETPTSTYSISGRIVDFSHGQIQLSLSGAEQISLTTSGEFSFSTELESGESYTITIASQPSSPAITCLINNSSGIILNHVTDVEVTCPTLSALTVSTPRNSLAFERKMQATAAGQFSDGSIRNMTNFVTWSSDDTNILAPSNTGEVTGVSPGSTNLRAAFSGVEATRSLQITNASLQSLTLSPQQIVMGQSSQLPMRATGIFSDGTQFDLTSEVTWASSNSQVAQITGSLLAAGVAGAATISATLGAVSNSTAVTVTNATLESLQISPILVRSQIGTFVQLYATGLYSDNSFRDVTSLVTWTSANHAAVAISHSGLASVQQTGTVVITAQLQGQMAIAQVVGENKILSSINIESPSSTLPVNQSLQLKAIGLFSDGSQQDITNSVSWTSTFSNIAEVSALDPHKGRVTGLNSGVTRIQAQLSGVLGLLDLTVNSANLVSLSILPASTLISRLTNLNYRARGTFSDGSVLDLTDLVTWTSSNSSQALMTSGGELAGLMTNLYNGVAYPSLTISASYSGQSANSLLTITPANLTSIQINPSSASLNTLSDLPLKAYGIFSDGAAVDLTSVVTWRSDNNELLFTSNAIETSGNITTLAEGVTTARAQLGVLTGASSITIDDLAPEFENSTGVGLTAAYYTGVDFNILRGTRIDSSVDYGWGTGLAPLGVGDSFSVRWTGFLKAPATGNYQFCTRSDDGVRLRINGTLIINNWTDHAETENCSGQIALTEGSMNSVLLEFYERGGHAVIRLNWVRPGFAKENIAKEFLYPE
jgi:hypothetical protein